MPGSPKGPESGEPGEAGPGEQEPGVAGTEETGGGQEPPGAPGAGDPGEESPGCVDGDEAGEGGWETSNQVPAQTAEMPPMPSGSGGGPAEQAEPGQSEGEGELDKALESFDGEIMSEREVIMARSNENAGKTGSSIPMPGSGGGSGSQTGGAEGVPGAEQGSTDAPGGPMGMPRASSAPPPPMASAGDIPDDIPDAKDDDIIARQLREAAMKETDPELKEKLWDEYRRYKGA
jgi:hypothetical protein